MRQNPSAPYADSTQASNQVAPSPRRGIRGARSPRRRMREHGPMVPDAASLTSSAAQANPLPSFPAATAIAGRCRGGSPPNRRGGYARWTSSWSDRASQA